MASAGVSSVDERGHQHDLGPSFRRAPIAASASGSAADGAAGDLLQLEMVRRHDVGGRHRAGAHEIRDLGLHERAAADVADHRIAAIERARIGALDLGHRIEDGRADLYCCDPVIGDVERGAFVKPRWRNSCAPAPCRPPTS